MVGGNEKSIEGNRVVYEAPGRGTGDTVYVTVSGDVWETVHAHAATESSGVRYSTVQPEPQR